MSSTQLENAGASESRALGVDMKLEVVTLPVSDVDGAKDFYERLGWRMDIDLVISDEARVVQMTPPHSSCSIQFGKGGTTAEPGSAQGLILVVDDLDAARKDLIGRGIEPGSAQGLILVVDDLDAARKDLIGRGIDVSEIAVQRPPGFDVPDDFRSYFA